MAFKRTTFRDTARPRTDLGKMHTFECHWQVQIQGSPHDLEHLARVFTAPPTCVARDERDGVFLYESALFQTCTTSEEVWAIADEQLAILSGVLTILRSSREPLISGAVYRRNAAGGRDVFVRVQHTVQARAEVGEVTVTVNDSEGNPITRPSLPPRIMVFMQLAAVDSAVAKVLRLQSLKESRSWVGLYRIYEVIEADVGGQEALKLRSWGTASDLKRFRHSANSVAVAGDTARHGKEPQQPPRQPMSQEEAATYVERMVQCWLTCKAT
jgi:hypothetical protein